MMTRAISALGIILIPNRREWSFDAAIFAGSTTPIILPRIADEYRPTSGGGLRVRAPI